MLSHFMCTCLFFGGSVLGAVAGVQQQPLHGDRLDGSLVDDLTKNDLIHELKKSSIIPDVLNSFTPKLDVHVSWPHASAKLGNTVPPSELQDEPEIELLVAKDKHDRGGQSMLHKGMQLTLALTDPDAPSREDPEWSQMCHWIVTGVGVSTSTSISTDANEEEQEEASVKRSKATSSSQLTSSIAKKEDVIPWKPPGPPPKTGPHRYVFVALAPANGTTAKLHLSTPKDRRHWGYSGKETRMGVGEWAAENGLVVIGANFLYSQNEEQ